MENEQKSQDNKTKLYVTISLVLMVIVSIAIAWIMTQNYQKDDTKDRYKFTKIYKDLKDEDYTYDEARGHTLYSQICAKCHGPKGKGFGNFPSIKPSPIFKEDYRPFIKIVLHGLKGEIKRDDKTFNSIMPGFKNFDHMDLTHVINFSRKNFGNTFSEVHPVEIIKMRIDTLSKKGQYTESELLK